VGLVVGVATTAFAANGQNFIIGNGLSDTVKNIATLPTKLTMQGTASGPALQVTQQSTNSGARGVGVTVPAGKPPLTVNSSTKVANLNADKLDGKDFTSEPWHEVGAAGEPGFYEHSSFSGQSLKFVNWGSPHNTAGFYKDSLGIVHLKGLVKWTDSQGNGTGWVCGFPRVFQLPQGYRPAATEIRPSLASDTLTRVEITSDGWVRHCDPNRTFFPGDWLLLDGISFRAAN
jgi:hypothetical protein